MQPQIGLAGSLRPFFDVFVFTSLFLALCAVGMVYQTGIIFRLPVTGSLLFFTFFGTLCSYNFHWYFTPASFGGSRKIAWSVRHKKLHGLLFLFALAGALFFTWHMRDHWRWLLVTAFITFLYSAPKIPHPLAGRLQKIAVGKTIFLSFAWTHVTALLPLVLKSPILPDAAITFVLNRFFLIYAICILFDYRDRESDRKEGIRSLLTLLQKKGIATLFWGIMAAFVISSAILVWQAIPFLTVAALFFPGLVVAALYRHCLTHHGDYLYYFVLDGLMAFSVPLVMLVGT